MTDVSLSAEDVLCLHTHMSDLHINSQHCCHIHYKRTHTSMCCEYITNGQTEIVNGHNNNFKFVC